MECFVVRDEEKDDDKGDDAAEDDYKDGNYFHDNKDIEENNSNDSDLIGKHR